MLGFITISLRAYSRLLVTRAFGADDGLIIIAYIMAVAMSSLIIVGNLDYFSGRHIWDVPIDTFVPHRKNAWWTEILYVLSSSMVKISVLLFYRRLSVNFTRTFLWATWIGIGINVTYMVTFILGLILICRPLDAYWNSFNPAWAKTHKYSCGAENITLPVSSAISVLTDLYATLVPMLLITSIKKSMKEKVALYSLFSLGFVVVFFGILRTVVSYRIYNVTYDFTYYVYIVWIWLQLEVYTAILAASAPALRPLFQHVVVIMTSEKGSRPSMIPHYAYRQSYGPGHTIGSSAQRSRSSAAIIPDKSAAASEREENPFELAETIEEASRSSSPQTPGHHEEGSYSWLSTDNNSIGGRKAPQEKRAPTLTTIPLTPRMQNSNFGISQPIRRRSLNFDPNHPPVLASP